jgi:hypothetical protein
MIGSGRNVGLWKFSYGSIFFHSLAKFRIIWCYSNIFELDKHFYVLSIAASFRAFFAYTHFLALLLLALSFSFSFYSLKLTSVSSQFDLTSSTSLIMSILFFKAFEIFSNSCFFYFLKYFNSYLDFYDRDLFSPISLSILLSNCLLWYIKCIFFS